MACGKNTTLKNEEFQQNENRQTGYHIIPDNGDWNVIKCDNVVHPAIWGAGGVHSSSADLCNYARAIINGGFFEGNSIISKESIT